MRQLLRGKIHKAVVTDTDPDYIGSITIDQNLVEKADIWPGELVLVSDIDNGARFETYVLEGGKGVVEVNGAAAKLVKEGDRVIVMAFAYLTPEEAKGLKPSIVLLNDRNQIVRRL
jgi:aspartate 1-decarboxylase